MTLPRAAARTGTLIRPAGAAHCANIAVSDEARNQSDFVKSQAYLRRELSIRDYRDAVEAAAGQKFDLAVDVERQLVPVMNSRGELDIKTQIFEGKTRRRCVSLRPRRHYADVSHRLNRVLLPDEQ